MQRYYTQALSFLRLPLNALQLPAASNKLVHKLWFVWICLLAITFWIQFTTIGLLPHLQQDEVQITDYGRLTIAPTSDWSVTWLVGNEKPLLLWSYIGPLIAEVSYQLGGASGTGPRIASLLGGLFAATMALGWLLSRGVFKYAAMGLSLALLLDPLFDLSQRMARVDSWVIAFCLASCWLLHSLALKKDKVSTASVMAAGALAAVAALVWPSAVFLYPLIICELVFLVQSRVTLHTNRKFWFFITASFMTGGLLCIILLLLPIVNDLPVIWADMKSMVALNVKPSQSSLERFKEMFSSQPWSKLIKAYVKTCSPFLPLIGLIGAVYNRDKGLILSFLLALALMLATLVYEFRVLYLLPYFLVFCGGMFKITPPRPVSLAMRRFSMVALVFLIVWSTGISLFARSAIALNERATRDRNLIYKAAVTSIGRGNYNVFLGFTYEFYFAGRSLGWKLYTPYIQFEYDSSGNWIRKNDYEPKDKFLKLLSTMDYAIFSKGEVNDQLSNQLMRSGLVYQNTLQVSAPHKSSSAKSRNAQIFLWFLSGKDDYGPYQLYARKSSMNLSHIRNSSTINLQVDPANN